MMDRRAFLRTASSFALVPAGLSIGTQGSIRAQAPAGTPIPEAPEDMPVDRRARELVDRLTGLSPLAVLEALESGNVANEALQEAGGDMPVTARAWNDPLDTDLEHALGGALIVASDDPVSSPDLVMLGAYIVFESSEIAFAVFSRQIAELGNGTSMSVAGTKAWLSESDDLHLAIMRLGYVVVIADATGFGPQVAEGMIDHLDALTQTMA